MENQEPNLKTQSIEVLSYFFKADTENSKPVQSCSNLKRPYELTNIRI